MSTRDEVNKILHEINNENTLVKTGDEINVEEIMAEIRQGIIKNGYQSDNIDFSSIPGISPYGSDDLKNRLADNIGSLRTDHYVVSYRVLKSNRILGPFIILTKKAIRKALGFYIEPIVNDQNVINRLATYSLSDMYYELETLKKRVKYLEEEIKRQK